MVHTDHEALVWLMESALLRGRLERCIWTIQNIPFKIKQRAETDSVVALSRDVLPPPTCPHFNEVLQLIKETQNLPNLSELIR